MSKSLRTTQYTPEYDEYDIEQAFATLRKSKEKLHIQSARRIIEADPGRSRLHRMYALSEKIFALIEEAEAEVLYPGDKTRLYPEFLNYEFVKQLLWRQAEAAGFESAELIAEGALEVVGITFD